MEQHAYVFTVSLLLVSNDTSVIYSIAPVTISGIAAMQAIRAGTIDISKDPYHFALPPTWKQGKVANIQSGNFCQVCSSCRYSSGILSKTKSADKGP